MTFDDALYGEPACRIMLLLNQHTLCNLGDEKCMTLDDVEAAEQLKKKDVKNG